jgi:hypothetical protein
MKRSLRSGGARLGDTVPLSQVRIPAPLIPRYGDRADPKLTAQNSLEFSTEFHLNHLFDKELYSFMLQNNLQVDICRMTNITVAPFFEQQCKLNLLGPVLKIGGSRVDALLITMLSSSSPINGHLPSLLGRCPTGRAIHTIRHPCLRPSGFVNAVLSHSLGSRAPWTAVPVDFKHI